MYGLPPGFDTTRLVGCVLEQVSFSGNTVHLSFSNAVSITIESAFAHAVHGDLVHAPMTRIPVRESRLMELLGESIVSAQGSEEGTLSLIFTNGQALACVDDNPQYEAYRLKLGEEEIIV
jgi:hypothetical protein